jgi:3-deoxy-7-phosphoheptulonate synthase
MLIVMKPNSTPQQIENVINQIKEAGVDMVKRITQPFKLASRQFHPENSIFPIDGFQVGGNEIVVIAGPCAVESRSQILETAQAVREAGANALRGGVFKPRTSP